MAKLITAALFLIILTSTVFSISSCSFFSKSVDANLTIEKLD